MTREEATAAGFRADRISVAGFYEWVRLSDGAKFVRWCYPHHSGQCFVIHVKGQDWILPDDGWLWRGPIQAPDAPPHETEKA